MMTNKDKKVKKRIEKEMTVSQLIWRLIKLRFKYGNLLVKTWVQGQGWCDLYEPGYEGHINYGNNFISIY